MQEGIENRIFGRNPIELTLRIRAQDFNGEEFEDPAKLCDVSGGGAKFRTAQGKRYYSNQTIEVRIALPGFRDVQASMEAPATVVRIVTQKAQKRSDHTTKTEVAVKFNKPLQLERPTQHREKAPL